MMYADEVDGDYRKNCCVVGANQRTRSVAKNHKTAQKHKIIAFVNRIKNKVLDVRLQFVSTTAIKQKTVESERKKCRVAFTATLTA